MGTNGNSKVAIERIYQVVVLGAGVAEHAAKLRALISKRVSELAEDLPSALRFFGPDDVHELSATSPAVAVYLGGVPIADDVAAERLRADSIPVLPVVADYKHYKAWTPESLHAVNGSDMNWDEPDMTEIVNKVLENLSLLRRERRLFISYRREESLEVAHQLRVAFDDAGYDTFLDLSSVPKGDDFQAVLWHRLLDSDVVVVLDTPNFLESYWAEQEIAKATAASVGMLRVAWPGVARVRKGELAWPLQLALNDLKDPILTKEAVKRIVTATEALRARNLAARYTNLVREFCKAAEGAGAEVVVQPERFVMVRRADGRRIAVVPTVGMPDARRYHEASMRFPVAGEMAEEAWLLYDNLGMQAEWTLFLDWLDDHLPVKGLRVTQTEARMRLSA